MGKEGLREIVPTCFECPDKGACLREALQTDEGLALRSEALKRSSERGWVGRFRRWSEKKELSRVKKGRKGEKGWLWS